MASGDNIQGGGVNTAEGITLLVADQGDDGYFFGTPKCIFWVGPTQAAGLVPEQPLDGI
jgi:hypothetical protein